MLRAATFFFLTFIMSYCFGQTANIDLKRNTALHYLQTVNGVQDDLMIGIIKDSVNAAPKIGWSTHAGSGAPSKMYSYSAKSFNSSNILYLKIDEKLTPIADATIMIISNRSFEDVTKGKTMIRINGGSVTGFEVTGKEKLQVTVDSKPSEVEAYHLQSIGSGTLQELWILNNAHNPIILKAKGLYNLELTEVKL